MHENNRQPFRPAIFWLPMAMAKHAAAIFGINFNFFSNWGELKRWPRQIIADDCLQMAARQAPSRLELSKPVRQIVC